MNVPIIQFLRPDGRTRDVSCEVDDSLQAQHDAIRQSGLRITAEELTTGHVSIAIEHRIGDFDMELCKNEPEAPKKALEALIGRFNTAQFYEWLNASEDA